MRNTSQLWIGGDWQAPVDGQTYPVHSCIDGKILGRAAQAGQPDVQKAIRAAGAASEAWRRVDPWARAAKLRAISAAISARKEDIAKCLAVEIGKPLEQGRGEVQVAVEQFDWFADEARRIFGEQVPSRTPGLTHLVRYDPIGIVATFTPWNFPIALLARKLAPALAAGCTVIARPAEEAAGSVAILFECIESVSLPAGTVNLLNGHPAEITPYLLQSQDVRKVSFTGSVEVGKMLARQGADTLKKVTLELGGHAPVIIYPDVDVHAVAKQCVNTKFKNAGQICVSPTRFFVHQSIKAEFVDAFAQATKALRVGSPLEANVDMGPLATRRRVDHLTALVDDACALGAKLVVGGAPMDVIAGGNFFAPTVLQDVPAQARVMHEEPFGPLAIVNGYESSKQVIDEANSTPFGLAAYAFTQSLRNCHEASEGLQAGIVCINTFAASTTEIPFGGIKDSGYGRECGSHAIQEYLVSRTVNIAH